MITEKNILYCFYTKFKKLYCMTPVSWCVFIIINNILNFISKKKRKKRVSIHNNELWILFIFLTCKFTDVPPISSENEHFILNPIYLASIMEQWRRSCAIVTSNFYCILQLKNFSKFLSYSKTKNSNRIYQCQLNTCCATAPLL